MYVSSKAYKIWKILFENPNDWLDLSYIGRLSDMSNRQVSSVLQTMNCPYIHKQEEKSTRSVQIMLEATPEEFRDLRREVLTSFHGIDDEVIRNVRAALSPIGWTSAQDIALVTGYRGSKIYVTISLMDDVVSKDSGSSRVYMIEGREMASSDVGADHDCQDNKEMICCQSQ